MALPYGSVVITDKTQLPGGGGGVEIHHPRQWFLDERDGFISWLRAEFAAANVIIDSLCHHLRAVGEPGEYDIVIGCIQQRRCSWNSVLHMQQYFPVAEVMLSLQQVAWNKQLRYVDPVKGVGKEFKRYGVHGIGPRQDQRVDTNKESHNLSVDSHNHEASVTRNTEKKEQASEIAEETDLSSEVRKADDKVMSVMENIPDPSSRSPNCYMKSSLNSEVTSHGQVESLAEQVNDGRTSTSKEINSHSTQNHNENEIPSIIPQTFTAMESYDGKMVNVAEGMNLYDKILGEPEVSKLISLVNDLRAAGKKGQLEGQTFVVSKRPMRGHGREMIQLGISIASAPPEDENAPGTSRDRRIQSIPGLLQDVIDCLVNKQVIPLTPDSCIIDFFNEGDHSQPHSWPHWFGRPIYILFLNECDMTFGGAIGANHPGDYRGSLRLSLTPGSLLVLQGKSANLAKFAIPSIRTRRILITLTKSQPKKAVPSDGQQLHSPAEQAAKWGPLPTRLPNNIRPKHYASIPAPGALAASSLRAQLSHPSGMPPLFVAAPVAAAMPFPAAGPLPPSAAGWAAAAAPGHPPPCLPVPGTGVFLPPPGSSNSSPPPKSSATSPEAGLPGETASQSPQMENSNINASLKGKLDGKAQRQDCNENVAGNSKSLI